MTGKVSRIGSWLATSLLLAGTAQGGFSRAEADFRGEIGVEAELGGDRLRDTRDVEGDLVFRPDADAVEAVPTVLSRSFSVGAGFANGLGEPEAVGFQTYNVVLSDDRLLFDVVVQGQGTSEGVGGYANFEGAGRFGLEAWVDEGAMVELTLLTELRFTGGDDLNAEGRVSLGLPSESSLVEVRESDGSVVVERTITTFVEAGGRFVFDGLWNAALFETDGAQTLSALRVQAQARIIPGPGSAALLALGGVVCARRRRS